MKWTVIYRPDAANELATIWIEADDRQSIADAGNAIDRQLGNNPLEVGESRGDNSRVLFEDPLIVYFDVSPQDFTVAVWSVSRLH